MTADRAVIEGLRRCMGAGVVHGNEVTVRDCYTSGTNLDVCQPDEVAVPPRGEPRPIGGAHRTSRGPTVEHCEFSCDPACQWVLRLVIAGDGQAAELAVAPLDATRCKRIVVHAGPWSGRSAEARIEIAPGKRSQRRIEMQRVVEGDGKSQ